MVITALDKDGSTPLPHTKSGVRPLAEDPAYLAALAAISGLQMPQAAAAPAGSWGPPPPPPPPPRTPQTSCSRVGVADVGREHVMNAPHSSVEQPTPSGSHASAGPSSSANPSRSRHSRGGPGDAGLQESTSGRRGSSGRDAKKQTSSRKQGGGGGTNVASASDEDQLLGSSPPHPRASSGRKADRICSAGIQAALSSAPQGGAAVAATAVHGVKPGQQPAPLAAHKSASGASAHSHHKARSAGGPVAGQYQEHWDSSRLQSGLKQGHLFRGKFRINAANKEEAYATVVGLPHDCLLRHSVTHNRAVNGDEVALQLLPLNEWWVNQGAGSSSGGTANARGSRVSGDGAAGAPSASALEERMKKLSSEALGADQEPWLAAASVEEAKAIICAQLLGTDRRPTCRVVAILEPSPRREALVGVLTSKPAPSGGRELLLLPLDTRMPAACLVSPASIRDMTDGLREEAQTADVAARTLVSARISSWPADSRRPIVELRHSLGQAGQIESETAAILEMEAIINEPFEADVLACLPATPWSIAPEELATRRDFRSTCVFSIDPPTAKDLDDALHIEELPSGNFKVGVHIADVGHFIEPNSALDMAASQRSTSVYLVQRVIPMLPSLLCEELCSLNPGVERLAFSVEWELDAQGRIVSTWSGRSVIRSCAKLAYPMVQAMIEGRFNQSTCTAQLSGDWGWPKIVADSLALHRIATHLRAARFANGALRLDNVRLFYQMDKHGNPVSCGQYVQKEANALVEEFMLLANMTVANIISETFPQLAVLRCHPPPNAHKMKELTGLSEELGIEIDTSSAGALAKSLTSLRAACTDPAMIDVVTLLATKPMQLAQYFCTGESDDPQSWRHYALGVSAYTHFTSPIRRYPDILVHRLLEAALDVRERGMTVDEAIVKHDLFEKQKTGAIAGHCNDRRLAARSAQDASLQLYLCVMLRSQPLIADGIVSSVGGDKFFSVYLPLYGLDLRVQTDQIGVPLHAAWDPVSKTLILTRPWGDETGGFTQVASRGNRRQDQPASPVVPLGPWLAGLPPCGNPQGLRPMMLPVQIRLFAHVTVVITSTPNPDSGRVSEVTARLLLDVPEVHAALAAGADAPAAPASAASPAAAVGGGKGSVVPEEFCIPYESALND